MEDPHFFLSVALLVLGPPSRLVFLFTALLMQGRNLPTSVNLELIRRSGLLASAQALRHLQNELAEKEIQKLCSFFFFSLSSRRASGTADLLSPFPAAVLASPRRPSWCS